MNSNKTLMLGITVFIAMMISLKIHNNIYVIQAQSVSACCRVSNRKYESMQNQSTAVFPSRSTIGKIENHTANGNDP